MAKANPASGTSYYLPEGVPVPDELPAGIRLVGPGVPVQGASEAGLPPKAPASEDANDTDDAVEDVASDDYESLVLEELRDHLRARDLPVSGNKAELIERLRADDEGEEG